MMKINRNCSCNMLNLLEETPEVKANNKNYSGVKQKVMKNVNKGWLLIQSSEKYRNHLALETCRKITESIKSEFYDGFSIVLSERNTSKSFKTKKELYVVLLKKDKLKQLITN